MNRRGIATIALAVAGSCSSLMGAYHFFLPSMFHWDMFVTKIPDAIRWGLFSINFFFTFLLLAGGILTFVALRRLHRFLPPDRGVLIAMAGFWFVNTFISQLFRCRFHRLCGCCMSFLSDTRQLRQSPTL